MKLNTEKALIGLGLGFILFLAYMLSGCFVDQVNIYLNDEDIRFMRGIATTLNEGDVVSIVPAIAGGRYV